MALSRDFEERQKIRQRQRRIEREKRRKLQKLWLILLGILLLLIVILCITRCGKGKVNTVAPAQATEDAALEATPAPTESSPTLSSIPAPSIGNNELLDLIKASGQTHHVYLTFDEGPDPDVTPKILDALRRYDVKATFFVIGREIEKYPYLITRIIDEGHLVLPLSYSGNPDRLYADKNDFIDEVNKTYELICDNSPSATEPIKIYRFPGGGGENTTYGSAKQNYKDELARNGYYYCDWNTTIGDESGSRTAEQLVQYFKDYRPNLNNLIVRMCNTSKNLNTSSALGTIVNDLLNEGYIFSRLDQIEGVGSVARNAGTTASPNATLAPNESVTITAEPVATTGSTTTNTTTSTGTTAASEQTNSGTNSSRTTSSGTTSSNTNSSGTTSSGTTSSGTTSSGTTSSGTTSSNTNSSGTTSSGTTSSGTASSGTASSGTATSGTASSGTTNSGGSSVNNGDYLIPE